MSDKPFYVLVTGGRDFNDKKLLDRVMHAQKLDLPEGSEMIIVQGGAKGADFLARRWALSWNIPLINIPADWRKFDKGAGAVRNQQMLDWFPIELVIAFPGGKGTADMVERADKAKIEIIHAGEDLL